MDITIIVRSNILQIYPKIHPTLLDDLRKSLKYRVPNYQYTRAHKEYNWDGYIYPLKKNQSAPSGFYKRIGSALKKAGHKVVIDHSPDIKPKGDGSISGLEPDAFQKKAMRMGTKHRRGIIWARIRSGKTAIIAMLLSRIKSYPMWVVTSASQGGVEVVSQTRRELERHLPGISVGTLSEGEYEPGDVIVSSYEALVAALGRRKIKAKKTRDRNKQILSSVMKAKALILDECHHVCSPKNRDILNKFSKIGYQIGLSGTPYADKIPKKEIEGFLGPVIAKNHFKDLVEQGRLAEPLVIVYELPYRWFDAYFTEYEDAYDLNIVENEQRNSFIGDIAKNLNKRNKTVYILVRRKNHGVLLREKIPGSVWIYGDIKSKTRKNLYDALQKGVLKCIITTVGREGLNLPKLDAVINAEGLSSKVATVQKMRSLTAAEGKKNGIVVDFLDKGKYLSTHSESRLTEYRKNKGLKIKNKKVPAKYYEGK